MNALDGVRVMVTRPAHQAGPLSEALRERGAEVLEVPALAIEMLPVADAAQRIAAADAVIMVSRNAVHALMRQVSDIGDAAPFAVGPATARALRASDLTQQQVLIAADSDALLALPELAELEGERIMIVRGGRGREDLAAGLLARGAQVDTLDLYRRRTADTDAARLLDPLREQAVDLITVTSVAVMQGLLEIAGEDAALLRERARLVAISERVLQVAKEAGFEQPVVLAHRPDDSGMVDAIVEWAARQVDTHGAPDE